MLKMRDVRHPIRLRTYQYRIYPTAKQRLTLESWLDACQNLYNQGLAMRIETLKKTGKSIRYNSQAGMLTVLRCHSSFWKSIHIDVLQDTLRRLDKAYDAFYRRLKAGEDPGFPRLQRARALSVYHLLSPFCGPDSPCPQEVLSCRCAQRLDM